MMMPQFSGVKTSGQRDDGMANDSHANSVPLVPGAGSATDRCYDRICAG
jgi:hypothetical protein